MNRIAIASLAVLAFLATGCDKLKSRDLLNRGVEAYKATHYAEAADYFKQAAALDPTNMNGRLYLATSYMTQYIPGAESPENMQLAKEAKEEFLKVLDQDKNNTLALESLASLSYNQAQGMPDLDAKFKKLDEAKEWYLKLIAADPKKQTGFYSLGVIDWLKAYPVRMTARSKLGMKPEEPGPIKDKKVREELKEQNGPLVEDGIKNLHKALDIDPNYDDAMAYMNLLLRERADLEDDKAAYDKDIQEAEGWIQKSLDTKKMKAAKAAQATQGGITQDAK